MIELKGVSFGYTAGRQAVAGLSVRFPPQSITAVIGPNGCGKSTLLKLCGGLLRPSLGEVYLQGRPLASYSPRQRARKISMLLQEQPRSRLTAEQVVLAGRAPYRRPGHPFTPQDRSAAQEAMHQTGCFHLRGAELAALSGGERQKVLLAMVLAQGTDLLLLDEPTAALDIRAALELMALVRELPVQMGKTVVLVLHDLDLALRYAHRVVVLEAGGLAWEGFPGDLAGSGALELVFGVSAHRFRAQEEFFYGFTRKTTVSPADRQFSAERGIQCNVLGKE